MHAIPARTISLADILCQRSNLHSEIDMFNMVDDTTSRPASRVNGQTQTSLNPTGRVIYIEDDHRGISEPISAPESKQSSPSISDILSPP